jgi:16S rRNA G966 N2-methylase RsmD
MSRMLRNGWIESRPKVYAPVPLSELRALLLRDDSESRAAMAGMRFRILDGAHRMKAVRRLIKDPNVAGFDQYHMIEVEVLPETPSVVRRSLDATAENAANNKDYAKKTFADDLWTMLLMRAEVVARVVKFSEAIADPDPAIDPNAVRPSRGKQKAVAFKDLRKPEENPKFVAAYLEYIDKNMIRAKDPDKEVRHLRSCFNPTLKKHWDSLHPTAILALLGDEHDSSARAENLINPKNQGVLVKWRMLNKFLPFHAVLREEDGENDFLSGGNGIVFQPDHDIRLWDYLSLYNDTLQAKERDALSYRRLYNAAFANNAYERVFCGLLMMTQLTQLHEPEFADINVGYIYAGVASVFTQYDAATSSLTRYDTVEELVLPFIKLDNNTFQFIVIPEKDEWTNHKEFKSFTQHSTITKTHPYFSKTYSEMDVVDKTHDDECRQLAGCFLRDIARSRPLATGTKDLRDDLLVKMKEDFGFFHEKRGTVCDKLSRGDLTEYTRAKFRAVRVVAQVSAVRAGDGHESRMVRAGNAGGASGDHSDDGDDEVMEPPTARLRLTQPDADISEAKRRCVEFLKSKDNVHMYSCSYEDFPAQAEVQSLFGKVSLVLTDPPYNTRRASTAAPSNSTGQGENSEHDKLTVTDMTKIGDAIEKLLRPHGHAFIFCSFEQAYDWRTALLKAGGGNSFRIAKVPEIITRDVTAISSAGRFHYHRVNAYEHAWHVYKIKPGATQESYSATVGWNKSLEMCSGSQLPLYCNVFNSYKPPHGREKIRANDGSILRPEQKSVALLRDIIRMFAPDPTDTVVDLFAGTMSTVVAALNENRPVYACENDPICFEIARERVHALQYRRGAAGLLTGALLQNEIDLLRSVIPARSNAPDTVEYEPETYKDPSSAP